MNISHVILYAIVPIIVVMLAGFISGKKGVFTGEDAKKFNKVVLDYALPAALFVSIVQATREDLVKDIRLTLVSTVGIMACFMAVYFVFRMFKKNTGADAAVSALISGSPTIGFLGFAVLEPIFGTSPSVALVVAIVGIVVNAIGIPVGLSLMNASLEKQMPGKKHESAWKPVLRLPESVVQPYRQGKRLYGCILGRHHAFGHQVYSQLAVSTRLDNEDGPYAGRDTCTGSSHAHGSAEP